MGPEEGFNALTDKYENLVRAGVIDPTKVVRTGAAERRVDRLADADDRGAGVGDSGARPAPRRPARAAWAGCTDRRRHAGLAEEARIAGVHLRDGPGGADSPGNTDAAKPPGASCPGQYLLLYKYLENRYADTVVLTFAEIEDLLGFPLPEQARLQQEWWTGRRRMPGPITQIRGSWPAELPCRT